MRLWTIHPKYLDRCGILGVWREALLAQSALTNQKKRGYYNHSQLNRFKSLNDPIIGIGTYLYYLVEEAKNRNYDFKIEKIKNLDLNIKISVTSGQLIYEWQHFMNKIKSRSSNIYSNLKHIEVPETHPMFIIIDGEVEFWEKQKAL